MTRTKVLLLISILLCSLVVNVAAQGNNIPYAQIRSTLQPYLGRRLPGNLAQIYGNEHVTFYLGTQANNQVLGHLRTHQGRFVNMGPGTGEKTTMRIYIRDRQAIGELMASNSPMSDLRQMKRDGRIQVEGVGLINQLKNFFISGIGQVLAIFS